MIASGRGSLPRELTLILSEKLILILFCRLSGFINQGSIQVNILDQITRSIRAGKYTGTIGVPKKIIYVAHSFGSSVSTATIAAAPEIADAVVLTGLGFSQNSQVVIEALAPRIASVQDRKWKSLDAAYLTWTDIYSNINW